MRHGFLEACEQWRSRSSIVPPTYLGDVFDGRVRRDFQSPEIKNFLAFPYCYLLTMNVDWFQPYKHHTYSLGAIHLTIQNLPRTIRYKSENIILVGIIPGPHEPSRTVNSYLTPLVQELQEAWSAGLRVTTPYGIFLSVKVALSCVACDIPASRKVCGFLGHSAALGCNKCLKKFINHADGSRDYSGHDQQQWIKHDCITHRQYVQEIAKETTKTGISQSESNYGVRFSVLLCLP